MSAAIASLLIFAQCPASTVASPWSRMTLSQAAARVRPAFTPPKRLDAKEPRRIKPVAAPARTIRATVVKANRPTQGREGPRLPMLSPRELARRIAMHEKDLRTQGRSAPRESGRPSTAGPIRKGGPPRGGRHVQALNQDGGPFDTTGITPWWSYHEDRIPGGGHLLVNTGLGNLIVQDDDMVIPHKTIPLTFERTYNAQGAATTVTGSSVNWTSVFGNGWTNTLDAHLLATSSSTISVYDVDGARYDFASNGSGGYVSQTPGQHGTLTYDGNCGMYWTKTSGMIYYFFEPMVTPACAMSSADAGYFGRLYAIYPRNYNSYLVFNYFWDNGDRSSSSKLSSVQVQSESGLTATLAFSDVSGRRLLQTLTFPDAQTTVSYGYDSLGNLTSVTKPANNSTGTTRQTWYGYTTIGSDSVMAWASSPRWAAQCNQDNCGGDGAYFGIAYSGSSAAASAPTSIQHFAVVNPTINDGYAAYGAVQSGHPSYAYAYRTDYYSFASWDQYTLEGYRLSTFRDTDGHMVNWFVDSAGRPTESEACKASTGQGTQCGSSSWLVATELWDANNNLVSFVDPRGAETDLAYDAAGNVVAIAQPPQYQGYARPTTLIDYDSHNNVTAVCDPALVHASSADWTGQYSTGSDSYCSSQFPSGHPSAQYSYPSYEPFGELASTTSAGGYVRQASYNAAAQGGTDFGLPTNVTGAPVSQFDGTSKQQNTSITYDLNGNIVCIQNDAGANGNASPATVVKAYDSLNRITAASDADDASLTGACTKTAGLAGSSIVNRLTYYPDGSVQTSQTPSQAAANAGTVFAYDLDGNQTSTAPYTGSFSNPQTATTRNWFDGMARLVETQQPPDPNTTGDLPISLRFMYDLSQNGTSGTATTLNGTTVSASGNMFDTEKNTPTGWIDFTFSAFDTTDRETTKYAFAPCPAQANVVGPIYCSQAAYATNYYWDSSSVNTAFSGNGLLVATVDGLGATRKFGYDGLGGVDTIQYVNDGGTMPQVSYGRDFDDRMVDMWNAFTTASAPSENHVSYTYTADGLPYQENNTVLKSVVGYAYYPDATLAGVSATAQTTIGSTTSYLVNQPNLYQYAYRNDGKLAKESFASAQTVAWTYTLAGRTSAQSDFGGATSLATQYDGYGRPSSYTTPSGTYASFAYDAFGRAVSYTDPYATVDGETVGSRYNIRGDLVGRTYSGGTASSKPGFQYNNIQGVLVQNPTIDQWDGRTGAILVNYSGNFTYDAIGRLASGYGITASSLHYDGENRLVSGDTFGAASAEDADCHSGGTTASWVPPGTEQSYMYDGNGQMFQDRSPNTTFNNHIITHIRQWLWNGGDSLLTLSVPATWSGNVGNPLSYNGDRLGSLDVASLALTVADKDFDGAVAQYHNSTGHSSWNATNPVNQFCISATSLPASPNYAGPDNAAVPDDGSSDQSLVVNSYGRAFLSRSMGYTTPDYSSATPYSSARRSVQDWCRNNPDGTRTLIHDPYGGHIDACAKRYVPPPDVFFIGIPGDTLLDMGPDGCRSLAAGHVPPGNFGSWSSGVGAAAGMTANWAAGIGPTQTYFNTDTVQSRQMMSAYGLAGHVKDFLAGGPSSGTQEFGLSGLAATGLNPTGQFVGSYSWSMERSGGMLNITITNTTTLWSGAYHAPGLNPNPPVRSGWAPTGRVDQTFFIDVAC